MKESVLYGFHGTLADVAGIRDLLAEGDRSDFYRASLECPPVRSTVLAARWASNAGYANLIFTRMTCDLEPAMRAWLDQNRVPCDFLCMREIDDDREDAVVKREMYLSALSSGYRIVRAWSSSPVCLALWRRQGVPVVAMPGWSAVADRVDKVANGDISS